jgi:hypothetical protein
LEAPDCTQDLLNIKWALRSTGCSIGSTWHEGDLSTSLLAFEDHWNARGVEQMQSCDSLVVICGQDDTAALELGMMAGFALARGLRVIWIGPPAWCWVISERSSNSIRPKTFESKFFSRYIPQSILTDEG